MSSQDEGFLTWRRFRVVAVGAAILLFLAGMRLRFGYDLPMPPPPAHPQGASPQALRSLDYSQNLYRAQLESDATELGLATPGAELELPFAYDLSEPHQTVSVGGVPFETRDLILAARVDRVAARFANGSMTSDHLILRIENKTDHPIAYRVDTKPSVDPRLCMEKGDLVHNAVALGPHEVAERTECPTRNGAITSVVVLRIETLAIPTLSYYYVSRLYPAHVGLDPRTARGHRAPKGSICADIPEQAIRRATEKGEASWRDVIDFYARQNCEKYMFPAGYRAFTRPHEQVLPVAPAASGGHP
jgi:hypothetical protein